MELGILKINKPPDNIELSRKVKKRKKKTIKMQSVLIKY